MTLQQIINIALLSFICSSAAIASMTIMYYYEVVKCPDLEGNLINYPPGTECFDNSDKELDGDNNKDDNN